MQWFNCWGFFKTSFSILQSVYSVKFPTSNCITERWLNKAFSSLRPVRRHEVTNRWWEAGKISNIEWHWFIHIGPVCEAFLSLSCWSSSPIRHGWYICVYARLYKQPAEFSPLGSRPGAPGTQAVNGLFLPSCEEQGSDTACPFSFTLNVWHAELRGQPDLLFPWRPFCRAAALLSGKRGGAGCEGGAAYASTTVLVS